MKLKLGTPVLLMITLRSKTDSDLTDMNPIAITSNVMLIKLWCTIGECLKSTIWSRVYDQM